MAANIATVLWSAVNISSPWRGVLPVPDAALVAEDLQVVIHMYAGILAGILIRPEPAWVFEATTRRFVFPATSRGAL